MPDDEPSTEPPAVLLDVMCGSLATYLRMCGYDAAYALDRGIEEDDRLRSLASAEDRLLVTRDRELAARTDGALLLTERAVLGQLREMADAGHPMSLATEPTRCGTCNGPVERVDGGEDATPAEGSAASDRPSYVPDPGPGAPERFWRCLDCEQWFWKGGHWESVAGRLREL